MTNDYLICCEVFRNEIKKLSLDKEFKVFFLGMSLHSDYSLLEKNLRLILKKCIANDSNKIVLVYGNNCLGLQNQMKNLANEFGALKINAANCIDCFLGGHGNYFKIDPEQKLIFLSLGWIKYFNNQQKTAYKDEISFFKTLFTGFNGIVLLDTPGELSKYEEPIQNFVNLTGLKIVKNQRIDINTINKQIKHAI